MEIEETEVIEAKVYELDAPTAHRLAGRLANWLCSHADDLNIISINIGQNAHFSVWFASITFTDK